MFFGGIALGRSAMNDPGWGVVTMPVFLAFVLASELRSKVALDSWWRASYAKGCWQYGAIVTWHGFGIMATLLFAYFAIGNIKA